MSTAPPPVQKKRGMGCFGCGCAILLILAILFAAFMGGGTYLLYKGLYGVTSPVAATVPTFDGGDDLANSAEQKLQAFNQALQEHQPASLELSADEMNTLISRDADFSRLNIHLFLTVKDDQAHVQFSTPTSLFPEGNVLFKDRFLNIDSNLGVKFDTDTRNVTLLLHTLQLGDQPIPDEELPLLQSELAPLFNVELQKNPVIKHILNRANTITIKDSEFVIETQ